MKFSALITCHNRRNFTLSCLDLLRSQILPPGCELTIVLVDDGSKDGTADAIAVSFPEVEVLRGNGDLYWCGGMRMAWQEASQTDPDYYLLVNDDTMLAANALETLARLVGPPSSPVIAVATIADEKTGEVNYGAINRKSGVLGPSDRARCETFNANCILVTRCVYERIGILNPTYTHSMGDIDYGLKATRAGIEIKKSAEFLGTCGSNSIRGTWRDKTLPRKKRLELLQQPKGLPFREWQVFCRRNMGWMWPYRCISPILRIIAGR